MKKNQYILLVGKERRFIIKKTDEIVNTPVGKVDTQKIKKFGQKLRINKKTFTVVNPTMIDLLKRARRMPQVILPKDAAIIAAHTGLTGGWKCVDAGTGSAFLAAFLGNLVRPDGSVISYEKNEKFVKNAKKNIELLGLEDIVKIKHSSVSKMKEKNLDLITLDMKDAEKMVKKAKKALKTGGWLVVYSPHIEQVKAVKEEMIKNGFKDIETIEVIKRKWKVDNFTHPVPSGILHTGFMTFARKI